MVTLWLGAMLLFCAAPNAVRCHVSPPVLVHELDAALFIAVYERDVSGVAELLRAGADPNAVRTEDDFFDTISPRTALDAALHLTAEEMYEMREETNTTYAPHRDEACLIVEALLRAGADPRRGTPLQDALHGENWRAAAILIHGGADVNASVSGNSPPIANCSFHPELYREMARRHVEVDQTFDGGRSALFTAALKGDFVFVKYLLDLGASPTRTDGNGENALAAGAAHARIVRLLLSRGVLPPTDPYARSETLFRAVASGTSVVEIIPRFADANVRLRDGRPILAAAARNPFAVKWLVKHGADVNSRFERYGVAGYTPLLEAVQAGSLRSVTYLLAHGASADARATNGETAEIVAQRLDRRFRIPIVAALRRAAHTARSTPGER